MPLYELKIYLHHISDQKKYDQPKMRKCNFFSIKKMDRESNTMTESYTARNLAYHSMNLKFCIYPEVIREKETTQIKLLKKTRRKNQMP